MPAPIRRSNSGSGPTPLSYKVPGATSIRIKQIHVQYTDDALLVFPSAHVGIAVSDLDAALALLGVLGEAG